MPKRNQRQTSKGTRDGEFRSKFERTLAQALKRLKVKFKYEESRIPYILEKNYVPDFQLPNGIYIEAKGVLTAEDRKKMKAVISQHPDKDFRFVFQKASNKLNKKSKTTYADWATREGIKWADGKIPKEWIDE